MVVRKAVLAVVAGVFVASAVAAQETAPVKIGFVDVERALVAIDEGKARLKELQDWAKPRRDEIGKIVSEINNLESQMQSKRGVASDAALSDLNRQVVAKKRELEDKQRAAQREFDEKQNVVLKDIGEKMNKVITDFADANRFTAVFILKPNDIAYLANSADITTQVIAKYNQTYPFATTGDAGAKK